jgi:hypothetical protein
MAVKEDKLWENKKKSFLDGLFSIKQKDIYFFYQSLHHDSYCTLSFGTIFIARGATKPIKVTASSKDHTAFCSLDVGIEVVKGVFLHR